MCHKHATTQTIEEAITIKLRYEPKPFTPNLVTCCKDDYKNGKNSG